jgi:hypothetical protein
MSLTGESEIVRNQSPKGDYLTAIHANLQAFLWPKFSQQSEPHGVKGFFAKASHVLLEISPVPAYFYRTQVVQVMMHVPV